MALSLSSDLGLPPIAPPAGEVQVNPKPLMWPSIATSIASKSKRLSSLLPQVKQTALVRQRVPSLNKPLIVRRVSKEIESGSNPCQINLKEPFQYISVPSGQLSYYVGKGNGWRLVAAALDKRGWARLPFNHAGASKCTLKWVELRTMVDFRSMSVRGALMNHIPNNSVITTKAQLVETLRAAHSNNGQKNMLSPTRWMPQTFLLDSPEDVAAVLQRDAELSQHPAAAPANLSSGSERGPLWIYKPPDMNRGAGIRILKGRAALEKICCGTGSSGDVGGGGGGGVDDDGDGDDSDVEGERVPSNIRAPSTTEATAAVTGKKNKLKKGVLQLYICDPLLAAGGFKFDIRCYLLIARAVPGFYRAYYHPGYCRLSLKKYSLDAATLGDRTVHLTNACVQKKSELYEELKEGQIQAVADVADRLVVEALEQVRSSTVAHLGGGGGGSSYSVDGRSGSDGIGGGDGGGGGCCSGDEISGQVDPSCSPHTTPDDAAASAVAADKPQKPSSFSAEQPDSRAAAAAADATAAPSGRVCEAAGAESREALRRAEAAAAYLRSGLDDDIMQCMAEVLRAAAPRFSRKERGCFDLLGFDFMLTRDLELRLLEVNSNPALSLDNGVLAALLPGVVDGALELVLRAHGLGAPLSAPPGAAPAHQPPGAALPGGFRLVADEETAFEFARPS